MDFSDVTHYVLTVWLRWKNQFTDFWWLPENWQVHNMSVRLFVCVCGCTVLVCACVSAASFGTVWRPVGYADNISGGLGLAEQMVCMIGPLHTHKHTHMHKHARTNGNTELNVCKHLCVCVPVSVCGLIRAPWSPYVKLNLLHLPAHEPGVWGCLRVSTCAVLLSRVCHWNQT